jgi:hypothetical protein
LKLIISHFFNEEYLLPWWLKHHREIFDHGILIDYHSTDRSADICRELVPEWEIVTSQNYLFAALKCDFEVMKHEERYPDAWKIVLNTTEFLAGSALDEIIAAAERAGHQGLCIPGTAMVDDQPHIAPDPDKPLIAQKYHGFWESEFPVSEVQFPWFFPNSRTRLLHRHAFGAYTPGRHSSMLPGLVQVPNTKLGIWWYGYSPWTEELIARKAQIQTKMDPLDKKVGFGIQHLASSAEQQERHAALLPFARDLDPCFVNGALADSEETRERQSAQLNLVNTALADSEETRERQSAQLNLVNTALAELEHAGTMMAEQMRRTEARPWRPLKWAIQRAVLKFALLFDGVMPDLINLRLRQSLAKRKPRRHVYGWAATVAKARRLDVPVDPLLVPRVRQEISHDNN